MEQLYSLPANLQCDPSYWTQDDITCWMDWCTNQFSLAKNFQFTWKMNGKGLCLLSKEDFLNRIPDGDVLFNCLESIKNNFTNSGKADHSYLFVPSYYPCHSPTASCLSSPQFLVSDSQNVLNNSLLFNTFEEPLNLSIKYSKSSSSPPSPDVYGSEPLTVYATKEVAQENITSTTVVSKEQPSSTARIDSRRLWEFLHTMLLYEEYRDIARWENRTDRVFRIVNPNELARLWGIHKNRPGMTYEKLSRALRYYYRLNIITKVQGRKLTYRFLSSKTDLQKRFESKRNKRQLRRSHSIETEKLDDDDDDCYDEICDVH